MEQRWNRTASELGNHEMEEKIEAILASRWPPDRFPYHIDVVGRAQTTAMKIQVWNMKDVNVTEIAYPEDFSEDPDGAAIAAVMSKMDNGTAMAAITFKSAI